MTKPRAGPAAPHPRDDAEGFNYDAPAEMYMSRARFAGRSSTAYRRFQTAAEAVRFAVEQVPQAMLIGAVLEVNEKRYDHRGIRELYDRDAYPLARH